MHLVSCVATCLALLLHTGSMVAVKPIRSQNVTARRADQVVDEFDIIHCPVGLPPRPNPLLKSAHETALTEEDSSGSTELQALAAIESPMALVTASHALLVHASPLSRSSASRCTPILRC
jgi:hypothetical protein